MMGHRVAQAEGEINAADGLRLRYRSWQVPSPRIALIVAHGLTEHSGRYQRLGQALGEIAVSTFAMDHRGHGRSGGQRGHVAAFDTFIEDLRRFREHVRDQVGPAVPMFVMGQSMGGLIVLRLLQEFPDDFAAGIIVSPWLATALPVPRWKAWLVGPLSKLLPALPFPAGIPADQLTHDVAMAEKYRNDPLVHDRITPRLFAGATAAMRQAFERRDRIRGPVLFMLAGDDRIVATDRAAQLARSLSASDVTVHLYPDYYHEILNEPGPQAYTDLGSWLTRRMT